MNQDLVQGITADDVVLNDHPGTEARIWAARITECWRSSVEGILRAGRLLIEAKADLPHGEFGAMCARDLPFSERTAQRLMAIGQDNRLSNPTHVSLLPASWGTLYELTKLSDDEFTEAVQQHVIRPDMLRGEAELIRPLTHRIPSSDGGVEKHGDLGQTRSESPGALDRIVGVAPDPSEATPMPSGGMAIAHQRVEPTDSLDFFPTPPWATRALIERVFPHLERYGHCKWQTVWEPACGEGHMAEVLGEYFKGIFASDIHDYGYDGHGFAVADFLEASPLTRPDWIISNPPFNDSADFVLKALKLAGTGVAMFVRLAWLESVGRYEKIFRDHPPTLLSIFTERVPLHKGRWEEDGTTMTAYIWLVWIKGAEPRAPFWIPPGCRETLTRTDDAKRFGAKKTSGTSDSIEEGEVA